MASSLEELLAEEGFRGGRSMIRPRTSVRSEAVSMPLYPFRDQHKTDSRSGNKIKTVRTKSDASRYGLGSESPRSDSITGRRPRDNLVRGEKLEGRLKKEYKEILDGRGSNGVQESRRSNFNSSEDFQRNEIVEVGVDENETAKGLYSSEMHRLQRKDKYSRGVGEKERYKGRSGNGINLGERSGNNSKKHMVGRMSFSDKNRQSSKQPEKAYERSNRGSWKSKGFEDHQSKKHENIAQPTSEPALDEVAVQAVVSILIGYIKRFLKDDDFRTMLRHNCFSSLNFTALEEDQSTESKVISSLEQGIETVERAAMESATAKDLKKALLNLSVITGLNSSDLKDGFTSGVANSKLSACAHLYLSVIYKLQKKDRISAKHLLQVFSNSPFQARTTLLSELWDCLFSPHLSHLKVWYDQEAESLADAPSRPRKLKLLEKVYNDILDSGTYQFAVYYKDWLTEGVEAPSVPSIHVPSISVQGGSLCHSLELASPAAPFSPQSMVSKKLYDAVFAQSRKPVVNEAEDDWETENYDNSMQSSDDSAVQVKQTLTYSSETVKHTDQDIEEGLTKSARDDAFHPEDRFLLTAKEEWRLLDASNPLERNLYSEVSSSDVWQKAEGDVHLLHAPSQTTVNEITLKMLAQSVFELQQTKDSVDLASISHSREAPILNSLTNVQPIKGRPSSEELHESCEYFDEESFFRGIPRDFVCPLTGQLFEDPVTMETGPTFERAAIKQWFDQGNRSCPVTGKTLEFLTVPLTNFVLKRVIDSWKSENDRHLLDFASQIVGNSEGHESKHSDETSIFILEQLLTTFNREERIANAKHLISLGGLQYLIRQFEFGNLEEKTRVAALLSCCIEADAGCRNKIARNINKQCLFKLLHSKQVKSRTNSVSLLIELICLSRSEDVSLLLSGLQNEEVVKTMHVLLIYLQSSPPEQKPLIAVLLLHLDLLVELRKYSIYREEAVDAIVIALDGSLTNENLREKCCRALLILGRRSSISRMLSTEMLILKQAGFNNSCQIKSLHNGTISLDEEGNANEEWMRNLSTSLLSNGKRSFLDAISNCLGSKSSDLVTVCLNTVVWLSRAVSSVSDAEFHLSAFSTLISRLKESLENGGQVEHMVLASMSLLNFSKIPECRVSLMTIAKEIAVPLQSIAEVSWTAKQLCAIISGEDL